MKHCLLVLLLLFFGFFIRAQSPLEEEGNQFNLSSGYTNTGIPIFLSYEMGIHPDISFGLQASYRIFNESSGDSTLNHKITGFGFFSNYYFNKLLSLDEKKMGLYAGINLSYNKWFSPDGYLEKGKSSSVIAVGIQLGYRYYFNDFAVFVEGMGTTDYAGGALGVSYIFR